MRLNILLIAHFCSDFDGNGNNRFNYLANLLAENGHQVELITTDFSHAKKIKRVLVEDDTFEYKIKMIHEPGYSKNVSLKRFYSHNILGKNLSKYLNTIIKPDVIYCAVPSLDAANAAAKYAKKNNIRFIIDVQDLWPESFKMVFKIPLLSDLVFYPMEKKVNDIYSSADEIVAVSQTYANRAKAVNKKCISVNSIFLGTNLETFDALAIQNKITYKPKSEIWIAYIGTLGRSYDLICVIDALKLLKDREINNIKFIVMGDGPSRSVFEKYAKEKAINCEFYGSLDYGKMIGILTSCDIAVNPIVKGSAASIINKHADYAAAGIPVINTQECREYRDLVDNYRTGLNCINSDADDLKEKILELYNDEKLRREMGLNSRRLAEERFNRKLTYNKILVLLESNNQ